MMVTLVSQCEKKALNRTRRVLDAFADRIGDNTWQTVITQEGLLAVKKLLRKTASKNTAVSCHWIRSRSRSELVWVVGNKRKFDRSGRVPVNSTHNNRYTGEEESRWLNAHSIQIISVLAALLHDIGKATVGFQGKLKPGKKQGDPYRHEWISLRLFQAMIRGCKDDESWLNRLIDFQGFINANPDWLEALFNDRTRKKSEAPSLEKLPPLAQLIAWLIVSHHRLPTYEPNRYKSASRRGEQSNPQLWGEQMDISSFYYCLKPYPGWVFNDKAENSQNFWQLKSVVMESKSWQKAVARWARKARDHMPLRELAIKPVADPFFIHMSRLCLMLADHNYSCLKADAPKRVKGDKQFETTLLANTNKDHSPKQALDEHLLGVSEFAKKISREIPHLTEKLDGLPERYPPLSMQTKVSRFQWQNDAFRLAKSINKRALENGFFGVNMASTGLGKTLGNARIMYALGAPEIGARFTIALGLRVLTLQTGKALRERLKLTDEQLAILVGGAANRKLFELAESEQTETESIEDYGSESMDALLNELDSVDFYQLPEEFTTLLTDTRTRQLLYAPVVTCTIDHIMQASESSRGGRQIAPILRLLTSDLVLDEPDDFDQRDLPALARLVYFSGLFGSKVLLSSATLTPDFVIGLFKAYQAGRKMWNHHMGIAQNTPVCCAWFDEDSQLDHDCRFDDDFHKVHQKFVETRVHQLQTQPVRRMASILSLDLPPPPENEAVNMYALAGEILTTAIELHHVHAETCPTSQRKASVGLVRMANVNPIVRLVQKIYRQDRVFDDIQIHVCCYHAKQLLLLRNSLEQKLDRILSRSEPLALFKHAEIQQAMQQGKSSHHVFIVVASPVAEVGRDHDYDWAIVEPSSMRSIIQLAGRVWRHRPDKTANLPNLRIWEKNINALKGKSTAYARPGFEQDNHPKFTLASKSCHNLITAEQLARVDAQPRIQAPQKLEPTNRLADLEHAVMADLLNSPGNFVSAFWRENNGNQVSAHLQKISPFRDSKPQEDFVCLPEESSPEGYRFTLAEAAWADLENCAFQSGKFKFEAIETPNQHIQPWLNEEFGDALMELADRLGQENSAIVARQYASVRLDKQDGAWKFHPWVGFWK
jgi:CRISPR-associated endonuclease/helicase Cas3